MAIEARNITAEELFRMPETGGPRRELVRGEVREMTPAGGSHGVVANRVAFRLTDHVVRRGLGEVLAAETGFVLRRNPDTVRAPDVAFVTRGGSPAIGEGFIEGAPDLAVEVVSPADRVQDVEEKVGQWLDAGGRLVWVVWPQTRAVALHRPAAQRETLGAEQILEAPDLLPGFRCRVGELFE